MATHLDCVVDSCEVSIEADTGAEILGRAEAHAGAANPELDVDRDPVETLKAHIEEA